ncbi:coxsackievirus and adenovirus receptor homolog [Neolamprologus brichardi]|uniref:coxsackievirus and adenovirus receptor homolog n=1 Tax=Neolamprologus brichardi TaxID=32507 RepID=UPI001643DBF7|nr:coxsackievirus and adenovirus receptor homolog [Neolamprologus brichardi]
MWSNAVFLSLPIFVGCGLEELKVRPGEDSLLQCQSPRGDVIILLEWRRSDLKSDTYVFFFRNQRPYENYQHKFFKGRVELRDPTMKDGDVSVILKNVSTSDTGTYECEITVRNTEGVVTETKHSVNLTVTTSGEFVNIYSTHRVRSVCDSVFVC